MIHAENAEKYIEEVIQGLPAWMEDERVLLAIVKESVVNHLMFAYNNKPNERHNCDRWEALVEQLRKHGK